MENGAMVVILLLAVNTEITGDFRVSRAMKGTAFEAVTDLAFPLLSERKHGRGQWADLGANFGALLTAIQPGEACGSREKWARPAQNHLFLRRSKEHKTAFCFQ
jgi:hypothetical protein